MVKKTFQTFDAAKTAFEADRPFFEEAGVIFPEAASYLPEAFRRNATLAMDAIPTLSTAPNSAVPAMLTTFIDPEVYAILFSPTNAAKILGEVKKGDWLDETAMFPQVEQTGEVSSYGDHSNNGRAGANTNWPQRQQYLYQVIEEYGERELARAGLAKINWVGEIDKAAAGIMNRYQNLTYFFGVQNLQNYGLINDPNLSAALTPSTKVYGGVKWVNNGQVVATANEVYTDIQSLFIQLVAQTGGLVDQNSKVVLALSPTSALALTATNSFNVNVTDLLKKNFPNIRFETAVQYGALSATNPQGIAAGSMVQMIAEEVEGQNAGYCAFGEKMRAHPIITQLSAWQQKKSGGSWGAIIRMPMLFASMIGI